MLECTSVPLCRSVARAVSFKMLVVAASSGPRHAQCTSRRHRIFRRRLSIMHASLRQESCEVLRCYYHLLFLWPVISQQIAVQGRYFSLTGAIADLFWGCSGGVLFERLLNNAQTAQKIIQQPNTALTIIQLLYDSLSPQHSRWLILAFGPEPACTCTCPRYLSFSLALSA
jgi:hypothetical protein